MKFKALIDGVHFDPKKGAVKIVLVGASHVSLDELTTLSPNDETIQVTFESAQTKIDVYPLVPEDATMPDVIGIDGEGTKWLKRAAERLRDHSDAEGDLEAPEEGDD